LSDERTAYQNIINNVNGKFTPEEIADAKAGMLEVTKDMAAIRNARKPKEEEVKPIQVVSYDLPEKATEANLVNGRVYKTPKGDLRWDAAKKKMVATQ
jgi:hypothetical protein